MEKDTHVNTWEACEERLLRIEKENSGEVWFRGLSNACWRLTTTLERQIARIPYDGYCVHRYWALMSRIKLQVESVTGSSWEVPEWSEPEWPFETFFRETPAYGFMAYLRHHGFPSPLLDWSRSPYIAAYFAFAGRQTADNVAIYAFLERPPNIECLPSEGPKICTRGWYNLKTHGRHFRQQSSYTACVERDATQHWRFVSHERIFDSSATGQLYKTTIPSSERTEILKHLDRFNLNGFSLFGSEEALMDTLAFREIDLKS